MVDFERGDTCRRRSAAFGGARVSTATVVGAAALGRTGDTWRAARVSRPAVQPYALQPYSRTAVQPYSRAVQPYVVQPYSRTAHSPAEPRRAPTSPARRLHRGPGSERASGGPPTQRESKVGAKLVGSFRQDSPVECGSSFALGTR